MEYRDTIIIGGGISGLYSAYNIKLFSPADDFLLLEKSKKSQMGGRTGNDTFHSAQIVTGAGVGRKNKDKLLLALLAQFGLYDEKDCKVNPNYGPNVPPLDLLKITDYLRSKYNANLHKSLTFKEFASHILGNVLNRPNLYKDFITVAGYTDYELEDAHETLFFYGLEDNTCCWKSFHVPWKKLVEALYEYIGESHFRFSSDVTKIEKTTDAIEYKYVVTVANRKTKYLCNNIIIAITIDTVRSLLKSVPIYNDIHGQPFLRLYAKFAKDSAEILANKVKGYTILTGPLQKIIPMDPEKGVYMIAYSDNKNATKFKSRLENTESNRQMYCGLLESALNMDKNTLNIIAIKAYYWPIGTHYYSPLNIELYSSCEEFIWKAQRPDDRILVVGEAVSLNQGWTEGALESVKSVLDCKNMKKLI